ncbi:MAG: DUF3849 domain-containing protein [Acutalibacteraceae bacterium]|nr:DUF3849 domain-containing protein [Acutalibacteraceae bacterium]
MDLSIRPVKPEEIPFSYTQSQNDNIESGCIGFLRGDFDTSGKGFYTTWEDKVKFLKTDDFKKEFDDVINSLRYGYGELLKDRSSLSAYCRSNPEGAIEGNYTTEYGFRVDTDNHSYILRCNDTKGDYNFYVYAYDRVTFEKQLNEIGGKTMDTTNLNEKLYDLMSAEQEKFKDWLLKQSPEEILNHTQEYTVREDILMALSEIEIPENLARALLESPAPLQEVYDLFSDKETDYMQTLRDSITETAEHNFELQQSKAEKAMTVLVVAPGEKPSVETIPIGLKSLQQQVGGYIEAIYPFEEPVGIVCNEEGKINGFQLNRALRDDENIIYDIVSGTFLVVGLGEEDFCSLTPEQIDKYSEYFSEPEMFFMLDGEIQAIPYNDPSKFPLYEKPFDEASNRGEVSAFRLSSRADNMCKTAIEAAISDNYSDNRLNPEGAKKVVENFGIDRVKKILALTVIVKDWDKRITPENKVWAKSVRPNDVKEKIDLSLVVDGVNPGLTDIFIKQVKKLEDERKPSVLKKLESAKEKVVPITSAPKKKEQVL